MTRHARKRKETTLRSTHPHTHPPTQSGRRDGRDQGEGIARIKKPAPQPDDLLPLPLLLRLRCRRGGVSGGGGRCWCCPAAVVVGGRERLDAPHQARRDCPAAVGGGEGRAAVVQAHGVDGGGEGDVGGGRRRLLRLSLWVCAVGGLRNEETEAGCGIIHSHPPPHTLAPYPPFPYLLLPPLAAPAAAVLAILPSGGGGGGLLVLLLLLHHDGRKQRGVVAGLEGVVHEGELAGGEAPALFVCLCF